VSMVFAVLNGPELSAIVECSCVIDEGGQGRILFSHRTGACITAI
jgi:hypothetical protein